MLMTTIGIPVSRDEGMSTRLGSHFGKSKYYALVNDDTVEIIENTSNHHGGTLSPPDFLIDKGVNLIIAYNMGDGARNKFQNADIAVFKGEKKSIKELVNEYKSGNLEELTEGCSHSKDGDHHSHDH